MSVLVLPTLKPVGTACASNLPPGSHDTQIQKSAKVAQVAFAAAKFAAVRFTAVIPTAAAMRFETSETTPTRATAVLTTTLVGFIDASNSAAENWSRLFSMVSVRD